MSVGLRLALPALFLVLSACGTVSESGPDGGATGDAAAVLLDAADGQDAEAPEPLTIVSAQLPNGNREISYEAQLEATGGSPPYSWATADLPPGLAATSDGQVVGTPSAAGEFTVNVTVTDQNGATERAGITLTVENNPVIVTDTIPALHVLEQYEIEIEVAGGEAPFHFEASGLPPGLHLDQATGRITNDPAAPAILDATARTLFVTVNDSAGSSDATSFSLDILGIEAISAGNATTCALDESGALWCWGSGGSGMLGNGQGESSLLPVRVASDETFAYVAVGASHTCAIDDAGQAWCWGENNAGQLGNGDETGETRLLPDPVAGGHQFVNITAAGGHTCAVDESGGGWCWGADVELGNGETEVGNRFEPTPVLGGHAFSTISANVLHTCAVEQNGDGYCWGNNSFAQLGNGDADKDFQFVPDEIAGQHSFITVVPGFFHTCAIDRSAAPQGGAAWCWGDNQNGELGNGDANKASRDVPDPVAGGRTFQAIAAGHRFSCALDLSGRAWCWGRNGRGQLGNGDEDLEEQIRPVRVAGEHTFTSITSSSTQDHACGLDDAGIVWCWGRNSSGQLGTGDEEGADQLTPVPVHPGPPSP
jgi:alpha-tubulin suppressor-like RCC1 family protein